MKDYIAGEFAKAVTNMQVLAADEALAAQVEDADAACVAALRNGGKVLFSSNRNKDWERNPNESELFSVSATDGALTQLTRRVGPDASPVVSPDGRQIAYLGYDDAARRSYENAQLYVMGADGQGSRSLTAGLDRSIDGAQWSRDGRSLVVSYDDRGVKKLAKVGLDGKVQVLAEGLAGPALDRPYTGGDFSLARDGDALLVTLDGGAINAPCAAWHRALAQRHQRIEHALVHQRLAGDRRRAGAGAIERLAPVEFFLGIDNDQQDRRGARRKARRTVVGLSEHL